VAGERLLDFCAARVLGRRNALQLAEERRDFIFVNICQSVEGLSYPMGSANDLADTITPSDPASRRATKTQVQMVEPTDIGNAALRVRSDEVQYVT
jgi:hypothetical protein